MGGRRGIGNPRPRGPRPRASTNWAIRPRWAVRCRIRNGATRARGAASRIRTSDLPIRSRVLSPLSQRRKEMTSSGRRRSARRRAARPTNVRARASIRRCRRNGRGGPRGPDWLICPEGAPTRPTGGLRHATKAQHDHSQAQERPTATHVLAAVLHRLRLIVGDHGPLDMRHRERGVKQEDATKSSIAVEAIARRLIAVARMQAPAEPSGPQRSRTRPARVAQFSRIGVPPRA